MNPNEIEHLLLENLKVTKEIRDYMKAAHQREQWARRMKMLQWGTASVLFCVAVYFLWPYIGPIRKTIGDVSTQVSSFTKTVTQVGQ